MKPVRPERIGEAVRRCLTAAKREAHPSPPEDAETIPVELGGVTRFIPRSDIRWVQAQGDYARLHTPTGSHLVRIPLATLEEQWAAAGFVRIHRSTLVSTRHISEIHQDGGRCSVVVDGTVFADAGASVVVPVVPVGDLGRFAFVIDPVGAAISAGLRISACLVVVGAGTARAKYRSARALRSDGRERAPWAVYAADTSTGGGVEAARWAPRRRAARVAAASTTSSPEVDTPMASTMSMSSSLRTSRRRK